MVRYGNVLVPITLDLFDYEMIEKIGIHLWSFYYATIVQVEFILNALYRPKNLLSHYKKTALNCPTKSRLA